MADSSAAAVSTPSPVQSHTHALHKHGNECNNSHHHHRRTLSPLTDLGYGDWRVLDWHRRLVQAAARRWRRPKRSAVSADIWRMVLKQSHDVKDDAKQ